MSLNLLSLCKVGRKSVDPKTLFKQGQIQIVQGEAILFWGKAAWRSYETVHAKGCGPVLVIAPEPPKFASDVRPHTRWVAGNHPLPGNGSFAAGQAILEFFDSMRRMEVRKLHVFLSGGASSLAWIKTSRISEQDLAHRLEKLYSTSLSIRELNHRRSKLCALKAGGAARWAQKLAPGLKIRVNVISDVSPFGPEVVGSGPFWNGRIPHHVVADNAKWVSAIAEEARKQGVNLLHKSSGNLGTWQQWVKRLESEIRKEKEGLILFGGEPSVSLKGKGQGGRQGQIAAQLLTQFHSDIAAGQLEILCASSDGSDGSSRSSGAWLTRKVASQLWRPSSRAILKSAIASLNTAPALRRLGALLPPESTGTNVQDVVLIRIKK